MIKDFFQINQLLGEKLQSGDPFSCLRIDNTQGYIAHCLYQTNTIPSTEFCNDRNMVEGGIVPSKVEYLFSTIMPKAFEIMKKCDILGFVDIGNSIQPDSDFLSKFPNNPKFFDFLIMDPGALLGYSHFGSLETPWTQHLKGKKVLVVSSHSNSIKYQWDRMGLVWGDKRDKIVPFELVDAISTPYHPDLDDRQYINCSNYMEKIEITKNIIDTYDYDVLLTGISNQSVFYAQHARDMGKVGIQTGATIQLFFGIVGNRWFQPGYSRWREMFNENWIWPMQIDEPQKKHLIGGSETSHAYWR